MYTVKITIPLCTHIGGKGRLCSQMRPLELVGASQPLGPTLSSTHFTEEEAEVQRLGEARPGFSSSIPFKSFFRRPLSQRGVLCLKPQGNKSFPVIDPPLLHPKP